MSRDAGDMPRPAASPGRDTCDPCPSCEQPGLRRSRVRSLQERVRRALTDKRLFRCDQCDWRGWLVPVDRLLPLMTVEHPDLDLADLDAGPQESSTRSTR